MDPPEELVQCKRITRLTLPYRQHLPPHGRQGSSILLIPGDIPRELAGPELWPGCRCISKRASGMPVPETSVDKHDRAVSGEDEVRPARQSPQVQPVPEAACMQVTTHQHLRSGVLATDCGHHSRPCFRINYVCHDYPDETGRCRTLIDLRSAPGTIADICRRQGVLRARLSFLSFFLKRA